MKKILSLSISVMMLLLIPVSVLAEESENEVYRTVEECDFYGPYSMVNLNGQQCVGFTVENNNSHACFIGMTIEFIDENGNQIGASSAYLPLVGEGETAFLYAENSYGDQASSVSVTFYVTPTELSSASPSLRVSSDYTEENGHLRFTAENWTEIRTVRAEITVVFKRESAPDVVCSGIFENAETGTYTLDPGSEGFADITAPGDYDNMDVFVTVNFADLSYTASAD